MANLSNEAFKRLFGSATMNILQEEASSRTNELRPFGLSAWNKRYEQELQTLKQDYFSTHYQELCTQAD